MELMEVIWILLYVIFGVIRTMVWIFLGAVGVVVLAGIILTVIGMRLEWRERGRK